MNRLTGQMQGTQVSIDAVRDEKMNNKGLDRSFKDELKSLNECLKACTIALSDVSSQSGSKFEYVRAFGDARQLVDDIGNVTSIDSGPNVDVMIAQDRARQMGGRVEGSVAISFMNAPTMDAK